MKIDNDDLVVTRKEDNAEAAKSSINKNKEIKIEVKKNITTRFDMRGMRFDEAKEKLDKYLDDCIYASLPSCTIIHGFGTGTMRKLVHDTLKNNKYVKESRYGGDGEGGFGVTVVTFKNN